MKELGDLEQRVSFSGLFLAQNFKPPHSPIVDPRREACINASLEPGTTTTYNLFLPEFVDSGGDVMPPSGYY